LLAPKAVQWQPPNPLFPDHPDGLSLLLQLLLLTSDRAIMGASFVNTRLTAGGPSPAAAQEALEIAGSPGLPDMPAQFCICFTHL
jgi:hypothetical protein